jgi:hypothetical protein
MKSSAKNPDKTKSDCLNQSRFHIIIDFPYFNLWMLAAPKVADLRNTERLTIFLVMDSSKLLEMFG